MPSGRGLLHRHLDLRVVPGRAHLPLPRSEKLVAGQHPAEPRVDAGHEGQPGLRRHLGTVPELRRREVLAALHRREDCRLAVEKRPQFSRHRAVHRGAVERADPDGQRRVRSLPVPRRRWPQILPLPPVGAAPPQQPAQHHRDAGV